eukprot:m.69399 g.69399  ORF g.69399 m.69399 type:complete len:424 (+) comp12052_c0_seq3:3-1274(+)
MIHQERMKERELISTPHASKQEDNKPIHNIICKCGTVIKHAKSMRKHLLSATHREKMRETRKSEQGVRISDEIKQLILGDYQTEMAIQSMVEKYNVSAPTIYKIVKKTNIAMRRGTWVRSKVANKANVDENALIEDYMKGELSPQEITDKYSLKYIPYLYAILKKWNIPTKRTVGKRPTKRKVGKREKSTEMSARDKSIVKLYAVDKLPIKQIMKKYEINSKPTLYTILHKWNVDVSRRKGIQPETQQKLDCKEGDAFENEEDKELQEAEMMEDMEDMEEIEDERETQEDRQRCLQESCESEEDTQSVQGDERNEKDEQLEDRTPSQSTCPKRKSSPLKNASKRLRAQALNENELKEQVEKSILKAMPNAIAKGNEEVSVLLWPVFGELLDFHTVSGLVEAFESAPHRSAHMIASTYRTKTQS